MFDRITAENQMKGERSKAFEMADAGNLPPFQQNPKPLDYLRYLNYFHHYISVHIPSLCSQINTRLSNLFLFI